MLGDIEFLAGGLWLVEGDLPENNRDYPDVPNVLLYRCADHLSLLDSGVGPTLREALLALFEEVGPAGAFTLFNSHGHVDHVANNDLIRQAPAPTQNKRHYLSRPGLEMLDARAYWASQFQTLAEYYDPLDGIQSDRAQFRLAGLARDVAALLVGEERVYRWLVPRLLQKYEPYHPSRETIRLYEDLPQETLAVGSQQWEGWRLEAEGVWVLPDRGHSPDHVLFYLPEHRLLHAGDLTYDIFNAWPDSDADRIRETIGRIIDLAEAGAVEILTDAHHRPVFRGAEAITAFLQKLLADDLTFRQTLAELVRANPGATVPTLYQRLGERRESEPVIEEYMALEYPHGRGTIQAVILLTLLEMGCRCEGVARQNRFFLPSRP